MKIRNNLKPTLHLYHHSNKLLERTTRAESGGARTPATSDFELRASFGVRNSGFGLLLLLATFTTFYVAQLSPVFAQGSLTPPGAPAPTMKTLDQIEPRTPISFLPYVISRPGAYYLTTNLTDTAATNGIIVEADDVSIDLCGFALTGSGGFSAFSSGIHTGLGSRNNLEVRNGTIRNWAFAGVRAASANNSRFEKLRLYANALDGLSAGRGCTIQECTAQANGSMGIYAQEASRIAGCTAVSNGAYGLEVVVNGVVEGCVASFNQDIGIACGKSSVVRGCSATGNQNAGILTDKHSTIVDCNANTNGQTGFYKHGIYGGEYSTVSRCTAIGNYSDGIYAQDGSTVEDCTAGFNATNGIRVAIGSTVRHCTTRSNGDDGIEVPNDCLVLENHSTGNGRTTATGAGIHTTIAGNRIEGNSAIFNQRGLWIDGGANLVIRNSARYNPDGTGANNFVIAAGNFAGPTNTLVSATITNNHPWANFSY